MSAGARGGRLGAIVFACLLSGLLVFAATASAATRATVTASASKARGCHTKLRGDRAHTDNPILFPDALEYEYRSTGDRFDWHTNPSTRPLVAGRFRRDPVAPPQAAIALANPAGILAENTGYPAGPYESSPFSVGGPPEVDNGRMTVHIEW